MFYHRKIICPKIVDGMANSVEPDQTAPRGLHCLLQLKMMNVIISNPCTWEGSSDLSVRKLRNITVT